MSSTLQKKSGTLLEKSKFFINRIVIYFSFLLIPVWIQKSLLLNSIAQALAMFLYILFIAGQWFLMGKEIDHRLKIYFRVNSSIDKIVYRLFLGMFFFILYFNILSFLPHKWIYNLFWTTWVILGLFYSWPTRGKIIRESVSSSFGEFKYLDSFEKTLVALTITMFAFSIPELPVLNHQASLKLFFDPLEQIAGPYWDFILVNYYPFVRYPNLFRVAWSMHFYVVGLGFFLLTFYAFLRYFFSRRLSLLGVFALISSWSVSKILASNFGLTLSTTYSLLWLWTFLWVSKSSTYRAGLFLGLTGFYGVLINSNYIWIFFAMIFLLLFYQFKGKTTWYKRQIIKYTLLGLVASLLVLLFDGSGFKMPEILDINWPAEFSRIIGRKAFYSLSFFGLIIFIIKLSYGKKNDPLKNLKIERNRLIQFLMGLIIFILTSILFDSKIVSGFSTLWIVSFFSLIPLELLFQTISRLRSSRNMIYLIYILICVLDSHFEGRVKIFLRLLNTP